MIVDATSQAITATPPAPAQAPPTERLPALDLARGIAVLMILPVNIGMFAGVIDPMGGPPRVPASWLDHFVRVITLVFFEGKFITLLSILFGAGLALQIWRAKASGKPFVGYYLRRMAILFAIGLAHCLFLWFGDILTSYAIVAVGALFISMLPERGILAIAAGCLVWFAAFSVLLGLLAAVQPGPPAQPPTPTPFVLTADGLGKWFEWFLSAENQTRVYRDGPIWEMILSRAWYLVIYVFMFWLFLAWYILACFLLGICLARRGVFSDVAEHRSAIRWGIAVCLGVGLPIQLLGALVYVLRPDSQLSGFIGMTGALPMSLAYLGLVLLWAERGPAGWFRASLQTVGRTALSNYLLQSVLCNLIFYCYGLRLYGQVGHAGAFAIVVLIWVVAIGVSVVWSRYFQMGPVEWAWRSLAEGQARPLLARGT
jgi:uncharacterized protein